MPILQSRFFMVVMLAAGALFFVVNQKAIVALLLALARIGIASCHRYFLII